MAGNAHNQTAQQLDNDLDLVRVDLGEFDYFDWAAEGYEEQDGEGYELTAWVDKETGHVEAVRTEDGEAVRVDHDIAQRVESILRERGETYVPNHYRL